MLTSEDVRRYIDERYRSLTGGPLYPARAASGSVDGRLPGDVRRGARSSWY